mmetsp:Transcript_28723/g.69547  ORF Transcript_28723/g.69547 Transcript_28723/m.69547 type:complete len:84 (-) Transcript_28723:335-586(-)
MTDNTPSRAEFELSCVNASLFDASDDDVSIRLLGDPSSRFKDGVGLGAQPSPLPPEIADTGVGQSDVPSRIPESLDPDIVTKN